MFLYHFPAIEFRRDFVAVVVGSREVAVAHEVLAAFQGVFFAYHDFPVGVAFVDFQVRVLLELFF